eukprot:scaffold135797_cov22-Tisochrysis_lutea.AAC.1
MSAAFCSNPLTHASPASCVCSLGSARSGSTPRSTAGSALLSFASTSPSASAHASRSSLPPSLSLARATMDSTTLEAAGRRSSGWRSATTPKSRTAPVRQGSVNCAFVECRQERKVAPECPSSVGTRRESSSQAPARVCGSLSRVSALSTRCWSSGIVPAARGRE